MSALSGTNASTIRVLIARTVPQPMSSAINMAPSTARKGGYAEKRFAASARPESSLVDVPEDEIEARENRDDVRHVHPAQHPRQDRHVAQRRGADLGTERAGRALRDDVV